MREIYIKHNPYRIETDITIDGKSVEGNSELNFGNSRFQEWVEKLPELLKEECNSNNFHITFHGTQLDYEDLLSIAEQAKDKGINIECNQIKGKEVEDKQQRIKEVFEEIKKGPFKELNSKDVINAFEKANESEFEVNVVATMSSGKSTLINSLLCKNIMPAKNEACTAIICKIKDKDKEDYIATAYDKNFRNIKFCDHLTKEELERLNSNERVSEIHVEGDIPFISSKDMSLVLVDTPGPNNSRDEKHQETTYRMLSESSKTVVLYVLDATQLATNDANKFLDYVANSMKVGGKQSKDRFMFVLNKIDAFRRGQDSVKETVDKVKKYLEDKGIENPNIFPVSALIALDIRTYLNEIDTLSDDDLDDIEDEIDSFIRKTKRNEELHLENYSNLPMSIKKEIENELRLARDNNDKYQEALIHTGIRSVEASINMYIEKYAKTAKIKNIVDTFNTKLESAKSFENIKKALTENEDKQKAILEQIEVIKSKVNSGEDAKKFIEQIKDIDLGEDIEFVIEDKIKPFVKEVQELSELRNSNKELSKREAEDKCIELESMIKDMQIQLKLALEELGNEYAKQTAELLLKEYKDKISLLINDMDSKDNIDIKPLNLIEGDLSDLEDIYELISDITKEKEVVVDTIWVKNENKKWWKFWTWFDEDGHNEDVMGIKKYVLQSELIDYYIVPLEKQLYEYREKSIEYTKKQIENIKDYFITEFKKIDDKLIEKLSELEKYSCDKENIEKLIEQNESNLNWLENICSDVNSILEI